MSLADIRDGIMDAIDTAASVTSVTWEGDPVAFPGGVALQWMGRVDGETEEIGGGVYPYRDHWWVLIATTDDETAGSAQTQALSIMDSIGSALNETVVEDVVCRPLMMPEFGDRTRSFVKGHAGQALHVMGLYTEGIS